MSAYENLLAARAKGRPTSAAFIAHLFTDFIEFSGDRSFGDDKAIMGGVAMLLDMPVTVIAIEKGVDTDDKVRRNFGAVHPEGYRKAMRLMRQAEKFRRPVVCIVDTAGAYAGKDAEERGQGEAIASNLMGMMTLKTPVISLLISEGGSGGALALAVADQVWMLEKAGYSVISPEGAASIIWKDASKVQEAADSLKMTAQDLLSLGVIEKIFAEPDDFGTLYPQIQDELYEALRAGQAQSTDELLRTRYARFRKLGGQPL